MFVREGLTRSESLSEPRGGLIYGKNRERRLRGSSGWTWPYMLVHHPPQQRWCHGYHLWCSLVETFPSALLFLTYMHAFNSSSPSNYHAVHAAVATATMQAPVRVQHIPRRPFVSEGVWSSGEQSSSCEAGRVIKAIVDACGHGMTFWL
jgi:hypothetical protein